MDEPFKMMRASEQTGSEQILFKCNKTEQNVCDLALLSEHRSYVMINTCSAPIKTQRFAFQNKRPLVVRNHTNLQSNRSALYTPTAVELRNFLHTIDRSRNSRSKGQQSAVASKWSNSDSTSRPRLFPFKTYVLPCVNKGILL